MSIILSVFRVLAQHRAGAAILTAGFCALAAGPASARCVGSLDPVVMQAELETGRDPAGAVDLIARRIAATDPADKRRLAELYLAQVAALTMSGRPTSAALDNARRAASGFGRGDAANLMVRLADLHAIEDSAQKSRALASIERDYRALPDGSTAKACRAVDLSFHYSLLENERKAFTYASQAYRESVGKGQSLAHAKAATMLAYLVSVGHDFRYAEQLHSEALDTYLKLGLSDLAANELMMRGYTELEDGDSKAAMADFRASAQQARSYGGEYAVDYALLGVCQAAYESGRIGDAGQECERVYKSLGREGERMALPATALMAALLTERGKPGEAVVLLDPLIAEGKGEASNDDWILALDIRAKALAMLGRDAQAYADMRRASDANRDRREEELRSGVTALQARFQTEELQKRLSAEERASDARLRLAIAVIVGSVTTLLLLGTLIFFLLRHRRRFHRLAMTDPLTGLANRRATLEKMDHALRNIGTSQPRASFALLDIDHFKWWNDSFGHDAGDRILNDFARVVERSVRPTDIVGRWGGEEFLVVLPATGLEEARQIIERVRSEAALEVFDFAPGYRLRFSAGIAMPGETGGLTDACIRLADRRLYAAKAKGRNRTCIEGEEMPIDDAAKASRESVSVAAPNPAKAA